MAKKLFSQEELRGLQANPYVEKVGKKSMRANPVPDTNLSTYCLSFSQSIYSRNRCARARDLPLGRPPQYSIDYTINIKNPWKPVKFGIPINVTQTLLCTNIHRWEAKHEGRSSLVLPFNLFSFIICSRTWRNGSLDSVAVVACL